MAVVVQKMVQCDVTEVGFTIDPISGRDAMLINANYGLGESVVWGETEVDQYVVERKNKSWQVLHRTQDSKNSIQQGQGARDTQHCLSTAKKRGNPYWQRNKSTHCAT